MAINLNDSIKVAGAKPVEDKRLNNGVPYTSVQQVNSLINKTDRYLSLEVFINDKIYWYKSGVEDVDLIEKTSGFDDAPSDGKDYIRNNGAWEAFMGLQYRQLEDSENLNDLKTPGIYGQYNSAAATTQRNFPYNNIRGGNVLVLPMTLSPSILTVLQIYVSAGTTNASHYTNIGRMFFRSFVNNRNWLPWVEFDGGKTHTFGLSSQNTNDNYNNAFPLDKSIFVLNQATTITVENNYNRIYYIKDTEENITFQGANGVTLVGKTTVDAPVGSLIMLVSNGSKAYVNTIQIPTVQEQLTINHNIGVWS